MREFMLRQRLSIQLSERAVFHPKVKCYASSIGVVAGKGDEFSVARLAKKFARQEDLYRLHLLVPLSQIVPVE
ncbi:hypothetical protein [Brevundimonas sp.]|uniref:hypothetical protein n=1 Tax=Brevundimonas sp. TaxID=1871086 RepID=UPI00391D4833